MEKLCCFDFVSLLLYGLRLRARGKRRGNFHKCQNVRKVLIRYVIELHWFNEVRLNFFSE